MALHLTTTRIQERLAAQGPVRLSAEELGLGEARRLFSASGDDMLVVSLDAVKLDPGCFSEQGTLRVLGRATVGAGETLPSELTFHAAPGSTTISRVELALKLDSCHGTPFLKKQWRVTALESLGATNPRLLLLAGSNGTDVHPIAALAVDVDHPALGQYSLVAAIPEDSPLFENNLPNLVFAAELARPFPTQREIAQVLQAILPNKTSFGEALDSIPELLQNRVEASTFELQRMECIIAPTGKEQILGFGVTISAKVDWAIIEQKFEIPELVIHLHMVSPGRSTQVNCSFGAKLRICGQYDVNVELEVPDLSVEGCLLTPIPLKSFVDRFVQSDNIPDDLQISSLEVGMRLRAPYRWNLGLDIEQLWSIPIGSTSLTLKEVAFYLSGEGTTPLSLLASTQLEIAGTTLYLQAERADKNGGWVFSGGTHGVQSIPLGGIFASVGKLLGVTLSPGELQDARISRIDLRVETATRRFTFKLQGFVRVGQVALELELDLDITAGATEDGQGKEKKEEGQAAFAVKLNGKLKIALEAEEQKLEFTLDFQRDAKDRLLVGTLSSEKLLRLSALARALGTPMLPEGFDIELSQLALGYRSKPGADAASSTSTLMLSANSASYGRVLFTVHKVPGARTYLLVARPKLTLRPSDLPFLNKVLPSDASFELSEPVLLISSRELSKETLAVLSDTASAVTAEAHAFPSELLQAGITLLAVVKQGSEQHPVRATFGASSKVPSRTEKANPERPDRRRAGKLPKAEKGATVAPAPVKNGVTPPGSQKDTSTSGVSFPVNRSIGPLFCRAIKLSLNPEEHSLDVGLDGGLDLQTLQFGLEDFVLRLPLATLTEPATYSFGLRGLALSVKSPGLTVSGGLVEQRTKEGRAYAGSAVIQARSFSLMALGDYAIHNDQHSLFLFASAVKEPGFGGPPSFYVKGLAVGMGYNRSLRLPRRDEVSEFPLVQALAPGKEQADTPEQASGKLKDWIAPSPGAHWLAAGVRFTSFGVLDSLALVTVELGTRLRVALLGVSTLKLPQQGKPYFFARMTLDATCSPDEGVFKAHLMLTEDSYILDPACKLSGGFALYVWFGPNRLEPDQLDHTGDFVVTLGGYHPDFKKPEHYPEVPRLRVNWQVDDRTSLAGTAYLAVTPSCLMLGVSVRATFTTSWLRAWFHADANFLIQWNPFYYDASFKVTVGVAVQLDLWLTTLRFSVEVGAELRLWGPPTGGLVHLSAGRLSYTIEFGEGRGQQPKLLGWREFAATSLPYHDTKSADRVNFQSARALSGLLRTTDDGTWHVRGDSFSFAATSIIPITRLILANGAATPASGRWESLAPVGIAPMNEPELKSNFNVILREEAGGVGLGGWDLEDARSSLPAALWGPKPSRPDSPSADVVPDCLTGIASARPPQPTLRGPPAFVHTYDHIHIDYPLRRDVGAPPHASTDSLAKHVSRVMERATIDFRASMVRTARLHGMKVRDGRLEVMATGATVLFTDSPLVARLGAGLTDPPPLPSIGDVIALSPGNQKPATARSSLRALVRQTATASRDLRLKYGVRSRVQQSWTALAPDTYAVKAGTTIVFEVRGGQLKLDGALPVRVVGLDVQAHVLLDQVFESGHAATVELPSRVTNLAVAGLAPAPAPSAPRVAGWQSGMGLVLVTPNALMGEDAVVHPQLPVWMRTDVGRFGEGAVAAEQVVDDSSSGGSSPDSWIHTRLPSWTQTVAVLFRRKAATAEDTTPLVVSVPGPAVGDIGFQARQALAETARFVEDNCQCALFSAPGTPGALEVQVQPGSGYRLEGILGIDVAPEEARARWQEVQLSPRAVATTWTAVTSVATVVLVAGKDKTP